MIGEDKAMTRFEQITKQAIPGLALITLTLAITPAQAAALV